MFKKTNLLPVLNLILIIIFIGPLIYISNFIFLSTDDFCRAIMVSNNFGSNLLEWYNYHNGRYINAIFSLFPLYNITVYRIIIVSVFLLLGYSLFWFVQRVLDCYELRIVFGKKLLISLLLYIVLIAQLPSLFEIFYWYAGVGPYLFSFIFLLFFLGAVLLYFFNREMNFLFFALIIILLNGNNELLIILSNFIILLLFFLDSIKQKKLNIKLLSLNVISWLSSLAVVLAPGTALRRELHFYGGDLWGSVKVAFIYGTKCIGLNLVEIPYLICYIIIFLFAYYSVKNSKVRFIHPLYLFFISYLSITSVFFIVYYATGLFGVYEGRMGNMADIVIFTFALLNVFNLAVYIRSKGARLVFFFPYFIPVLISVLLIFILLRNENYADIRKDITGNDLVRYKEEMENRFHVLADSDKNTILLEPVEGTRILKSGDKYYVGQDWLQYCYKEYINDYLEKNFESIEIDIQKEMK